MVMNNIIANIGFGEPGAIMIGLTLRSAAFLLASQRSLSSNAVANFVFVTMIGVGGSFTMPAISAIITHIADDAADGDVARAEYGRLLGLRDAVGVRSELKK